LPIAEFTPSTQACILGEKFAKRVAIVDIWEKLQQSRLDPRLASAAAAAGDTLQTLYQSADRQCGVLLTCYGTEGRWQLWLSLWRPVLVDATLSIFVAPYPNAKNIKTKD
jgi:hypothetical protein